MSVDLLLLSFTGNDYEALYKINFLIDVMHVPKLILKKCHSQSNYASVKLSKQSVCSADIILNDNNSAVYVKTAIVI